MSDVKQRKQKVLKQWSARLCKKTKTESKEKSHRFLHRGKPKILQISNFFP